MINMGSYLKNIFDHNNFRYGVFKVGYDNVEAAVVYEDDFVKITIPLIILWIYVLILILREFWQIFKYKKRYNTCTIDKREHTNFMLSITFISKTKRFFMIHNFSGIL